MQAEDVGVSPELGHGLGLTLHFTNVLLVKPQVLHAGTAKHSSGDSSSTRNLCLSTSTPYTVVSAQLPSDIAAQYRIRGAAAAQPASPKCVHTGLTTQLPHAVAAAAAACCIPSAAACVLSLASPPLVRVDTCTQRVRASQGGTGRPALAA
jgi:hypothetical protein